MGSTINNRVFLKKSSLRRDDSAPFSKQDNLDKKITPVSPEPKKTPNTVKDIIFKKTEEKSTEPEVKKIDTLDLKLKEKEASIDLLSPTSVITEIATDAVTKVTDAVIDKAKDIINSFTLDKLPTHDLDFASAWYYTNYSDLNPDNITLEYNANLQALKELRSGTLKLPSGFDGKDIAYQLDTHILRDFREKQLKYNPEDNLVHRAWFAHCVKRAIIDLKEGVYSNQNGDQITEPRIAATLERRINEIILENTLYNK